MHDIDDYEPRYCRLQECELARLYARLWRFSTDEICRLMARDSAVDEPEAGDE